MHLRSVVEACDEHVTVHMMRGPMHVLHKMVEARQCSIEDAGLSGSLKLFGEDGLGQISMQVIDQALISFRVECIEAEIHISDIGLFGDRRQLVHPSIYGIGHKRMKMFAGYTAVDHQQVKFAKGFMHSRVVSVAKKGLRRARLLHGGD